MDDCNKIRLRCPNCGENTLFKVAIVLEATFNNKGEIFSLSDELTPSLDSINFTLLNNIAECVRCGKRIYVEEDEEKDNS